LLRELPGLNGNFDFDIFRLKGHCLLRKGNLEGAEICYHNSLIIDRTSEKPYLGLGSVALMKRNYIQAKQYYAKALQINPESDKAHLGLALLNSEQARYEETLSEAIKALELNIENQQALMLCLEAGYRCGRLIDAERFLSKYSELHPANAELVYTLAGVRNKIGDREGALKAARQVLMFHPDFQPATELLIQMG
jgi:tetratricopeptide (TPR) repeat protein